MFEKVRRLLICHLNIFFLGGGGGGRGVTLYMYIARAGVNSGYISRVGGIAAVKSHEAKPSAISPLYLK